MLQLLRKKEQGCNWLTFLKIHHQTVALIWVTEVLSPLSMSNVGNQTVDR